MLITGLVDELGDYTTLCLGNEGNDFAGFCGHCSSRHAARTKKIGILPLLQKARIGPQSCQIFDHDLVLTQQWFFGIQRGIHLRQPHGIQWNHRRSPSTLIVRYVAGSIAQSKNTHRRCIEKERAEKNMPTLWR